MKPNRRWIMIVALAATLAAVAWVSGNDEDVAAPVVRESSGGNRPPHEERRPGRDPVRLNLAALDRRAIAPMKANLFTGKSWYVPPPAAPTPPPKPTAPPLPFTYLGRMVEGGRTAVFVGSDDRNRTLRVGDVVDNVWRVDAIDETRMTFTYLPLNEKETLALGAAP